MINENFLLLDRQINKWEIMLKNTGIVTRTVLKKRGRKQMVDTGFGMSDRSASWAHYLTRESGTTDHPMGNKRMNRDSLSFRITGAREKSNLTKTALAGKLGVTRAAISQWESGKTGDMKARYFFPLAEVLKIDPAHLFTGEPTSGSQWAKQAVRFVPLLDVDLIGDDAVLQETTYVPTTIDVTDGFAIRLTSDSMSGIDSSFNSNSTVIFNKWKDWVSGDFVLAKPTSSEAVVFRQIVIDGSTTYLKAINTQYPTIQADSDLKVFGVAVETLNSV